jgi:hypothetical protein
VKMEDSSTCGLFVLMFVEIVRVESEKLEVV